MYAITPNGVGKSVRARGIKEGWPLVDGETFTVEHDPTGMVLAEDMISLRAPVTAELLKDIVDAQVGRINAECNQALSAIKAGYPEGEVSTWDKQEQEARAYLADNTAAVPFITGLAAARGVPVDVLATRIIEKADLFAVAAATAIGHRQKLEDQIAAIVADKTLTDDEKRTAIEAVVW